MLFLLYLESYTDFLIYKTCGAQKSILHICTRIILISISYLNLEEKLPELGFPEEGLLKSNVLLLSSSLNSFL